MVLIVPMKANFRCFFAADCAIQVALEKLHCLSPVSQRATSELARASCVRGRLSKLPESLPAVLAREVRLVTSRVKENQ